VAPHQFFADASATLSNENNTVNFCNDYQPSTFLNRRGDFLIDINKIPGFKLFGKDNENRIL